MGVDMASNKRKTLWITLGVIAGGIAVCLIFGCGLLILNSPKIYSYLISHSSAAVGSTAPDFSLTTLDGNTVHLSQFSGQPVVLNFGASWCPDCNLADPVLQRLHEEHPELVVLLVDIEEEAYAAQGTVDKHGLTFPVLLDLDGKVSDRYKIVAIPTIFFIDSGQVIQAKLVEAVTSEILEDSLPLIGIEP
jgi:peroxiredoxin